MATYPNASDVRSGVVYGPNDNDFTGTLVTSPVAGSGFTAASLIKGDSYTAAVGRDLRFVFDAPAGLTVGDFTVKLYLKGLVIDGASESPVEESYSYAGTVAAGSGSESGKWVATIEIADTESASWKPGLFEWFLVLVLTATADEATVLHSADSDCCDNKILIHEKAF